MLYSKGLHMIDWDRVRALRDEVGAEDVDEIIDLFFCEVERVMATLSEVSDAKSLGENVHFLKSGALNLGFSAFSDLCGQAEKDAESGIWKDVDIRAIMASYAASKSAFLSNLKQHLDA